MARNGVLLRLILGTALAAALSAQALADKRVALVIGNGAYPHERPLANPNNDAADMAASLTRLGFEVKTLANARVDEMRRGLSEFTRQVGGADMAVVFYAGHGMETNGENRLVPVDAELNSDADVDHETIGLKTVTRIVSSAGQLGLVILDACRDNSFQSHMQRAHGAGCATVEPGDNVLVALAARDGTTAQDGDGRNSPFTAALLKNLEMPGVEIGALFRNVRDEVMTATKREQQPSVFGSLTKQIYLKTADSAVQPSETTGAVPADPAAQAWAAAKDSASTAVLDAFLARYGESIYAPFAKARREELQATQIAVATPQPKPPEPAKLPPVSRDELIKLFRPFAMIYERVRVDYVDRPNPKTLLAGAISGMDKAFPVSKQVSSLTPPQHAVSPPTLDGVLADAIRILAARKSDNDNSQVAEAAINGMLGSLDPHSSYLDPGGFRDMQVQTRGEFGGVGLEVTMEDGLIKVVTPIEDAPAGRAGVLANDLVTSIDDQQVQGMTINQAVEKMRGPIGTPVHLKIQRKGHDGAIDVAITREMIRVRAVRSRVEGGDVGYIRITQFNEQAYDTLKSAISDIAHSTGSRLRGYVIDLRNNPGGLLDQAIAVSDAFLDRGEIVSTRGRHADEAQRFIARPGDLTKGKPIVVLINGGSASASEIVAGALQDHKRATVLGSRSFGKGSVQTIIPLGGGLGALRLTTARYYTPTGKSIQARGIVPDTEVLQDEPPEEKEKGGPDQIGGEAGLPGHLKASGDEKSGSQAYVPPDAAKDKALQAALERLRASPARTGANHR